MTRYKRYLKEVKYHRFTEDFTKLPYDMTGSIILEDRDVYATNYGLLVVATYSINNYIYFGRSFYLPNGKRIDVWEENDIVRDEDDDEIYLSRCEIRVYFDLPCYKFFFNDNDELVAIRHTNTCII